MFIRNTLILLVLAVGDEASTNGHSAGARPETIRLKWDEASRQDALACGRSAAFVLVTLLGRSVDYERMRRELPIGKEGSSLEDVRQFLAGLGLPAQAVHGNARMLATRCHPFIAHLRPPDENDRTGHYVVVAGCGDGLVTVLEPTYGQLLSFTVADFLKLWSGYAVVCHQVSEQSLVERLIPAAGTSIVLLAFAYISWLRRMQRRLPQCQSDESVGG